MMAGSLRVLHIEDSEDDSLLARRELRRCGYDLYLRRVQSRDEMEAALLGESWDLVLSDYVMPQFSGLDALNLLKTSGIDLPFIVVSGKIGEETAVEAMKAGAHDYILKGNLARLCPAIARELGDAATRRERRAAAVALKQAYEDLEFKVRERTAMLSGANAALKQEIEERKCVQQEREKLIEELREALTKVKTLSGLLPICASCKKIRDDTGYWNQIESYIRKHSQAEFSHGLCPECARKLYPHIFGGEDSSAE
ncbi:MAG: response regulator [Nitrospiraceae bacterium]|nr:response regulator [Nitrospiraceae bacterium]